MREDLKELGRLALIMFSLVMAYVCFNMLINYAFYRSRIKPAPPPTYGEIIVNELA